MSEEPRPIEPETKDWTFILASGCSECGFNPNVPLAELGARVRATIPRWRTALSAPDSRERPSPEVWSPLEYGCHVRDVCRIMLGRLDLMLSSDDAKFQNWDQDETARIERYWERDPRLVADEYGVAAAAFATRLDSVTGAQWDRRGTRSNGSEFTVGSLGVYALHDLEHHLFDVGN